MKPLHSTLRASANAKLILVNSKPMLSITEADGKVITVHATNSLLLHFGLKKEHAEMLVWLEEESLLYALNRNEQAFANSPPSFSIISETLFFETFKPQKQIDGVKTNRAPTV